jgi:hypothetical protein
MQKSQDKLRRLVILLITWALLLGFFLAYDTYFVASQKEFLVDREFRTLAAMSRKIRAEFDRARLSAESGVKLAAPAHPGYAADIKCGARSIAECRREYIELYLNEILVRDDSPADVPACAEAIDREGADPIIPLRTVPEKGRLKFQVSCFVRTDAKPGTFDPSDEKTVFVLNMSPWIRTALGQASSSFEDVFLVDDSGHVLLEQGSGSIQIRDLNSLVATSTDMGWKKNGWAFLGKANPESGGTDGGVNSARKVGDLFERGAASRIFMDGKNYLLFSHPMRLALGSYPAGGTPFSFLVCGLQREAGLDAESRSLPYGFLIWIALAAIVLLSVSWPLFKLRYMGNTDRFSPRDGWYLILALFLMSTATALILLNASYIVQAREAADQKMKTLAGQIEGNFRWEMKSAVEQLRSLRRDASFVQARMDARAPSLHGSYLTGPAAKQLTYPFFQIAFWADCRGHQVLKFDVRPAPTPSTDVSHFSFFQQAEAKILRAAPGANRVLGHCAEVPRELDADKGTTDQLYFEPLMSPNTDEFAPALAAPFQQDAGNAKKIWLQALAVRPLSVVDPVLPPGYAFAIIDKQCEVLFHSDSFRDLRENFCDESKNKTELSPWLFGGVNVSLDITYAGGTERAYLTNFPLPTLSSTGNAFLIVFEDRGHALSLNLAIVLVSSILLAAYFLISAVGAAVHLLLRRPLGLLYAPGFLWPQSRNTLAYLQLLCANALTFAFYWVASRQLYEGALLALTLEVPLVSIGFSIARLAWQPHAFYRWGKRIFQGGASILALISLSHLLSLLFSRLLPFSWPLEWAVLFVLPTLWGGFAVLVSGKDWVTLPPPRMTGWFERFRRHFTAAYALAVASLIACVTVVPCLGFFKYAYDAIGEISLKHDQAVLAERVLARRDRIQNYYDGLEAPSFARCRVRQSLDRYDRSFFSVISEPSIPESEAQPCQVLASEPLRPEGMESAGSECVNQPAPSGNRWNDEIEKQIASLTLTFPSNEIGLEMSRLGVASTDPKDAWERSWSEMSPRCFALSGRPGSRLSDVRVVASYPAWRGLTPGFSGYLLLFMAGLVVWLVSLARQIFLTKVESAPAFEVVHWRDVSDIDTNYLVIGRTQSGKSKLLRELPGLDLRDWRDLRAELSKMTKDPKYESPPCAGNVLILDHFEFNICDRTWNKARLDLLETILYKEQSRVVIVSTIDPSYFVGEEASKILSDGKDAGETARLFDRWMRALGKFTRVTLGHSSRDEFLAEIGTMAERGSRYAQFAAWVCRECGSTSLLRKLGIEILHEFGANPPLTRGQFTEIVLDRAYSYYRVLWSGLTASERLVLYQLALDGWANPKNASAIQQLERKQLVYKAPMYRVINDSFCRFVLAAEHSGEILEWEQHEQESAWYAFRFVLIAVLIGGGVWLLYSQAQLLQIGTGTITAIATLLTAIAGLSTRFKRPSLEAKAGASSQEGG